MNCKSIVEAVLGYVDRPMLALIVLASGLALSIPAHAVFIGNSQGGTDFPQGDISFADAVADYTVGTGGVTAPHQGSDNALGLPDYASSVNCPDQASCPYVSLGSGGSITLRFIDNFLTGSGDNSLDLWIFEVGPDIEDTFVEISKDGVSWTGVGKVFGSTAGIDIDAFGFDTSDLFTWVRLTDDPNEGGRTGATAGADIDAVGAISTIARTVAEPGTMTMLALGLLGAGFASRRRFSH